MDMMKKLLCLKDHRIRFMTGEGDYEGTISTITPEIELLFISKLIWLPKNIKFGTLTFRASEIKAFEVIESPETPKPAQTPTYYNTSRYYKDTKVHTLFDEEYDESISGDVSEINDCDEMEYELHLPPSLADVLPLDNVVIDELNEDFYDAIRHIKRQDVIGFSVESPKIGRHEELHWLCISTVSCTFLFDVQQLKNDCFTAGMKDILENPRIEKVIHDCREASDCIFHSFDTKLVNVFDTQVADYVINQQRKRTSKITTRVNPLNSCLAQYLDVPDEFLYRRKPRSYQDDLVFYGLRPVTDDLRDLFIKNVIYLRRLKQELDLTLVEPVNTCTDIYLQTLQNKTGREFELESLNPDVVPDEFFSDKIQIFRFKDHVDIPAVVSSGPPYRHIENSYRTYVQYCEKFKIGELKQGFEKQKEVPHRVIVQPADPGEYICRKSHCDGTCVAFIDGNMYLCKSRKQETETKVSSPPTNFNVSKSYCIDNQRLPESDSSSTDDWAKLRAAFADTGPSRDGRKLVFVPA